MAAGVVDVEAVVVMEEALVVTVGDAVEGGVVRTAEVPTGSAAVGGEEAPP